MTHTTSQWGKILVGSASFLKFRYSEKAKKFEIIFVFTGKSLSEALLFAEHEEKMLCTKIVLMSKTISVQNMFSPGLSSEFSCIELVIQ